jgi:hypothetical protein
VAAIDPRFAAYDTSGAPNSLDDWALLSASIRAIQELNLQVASLSATTTIVSLIDATSTSSTTTPSAAPLANASNTFRSSIAAFGDAITHVFTQAIYAAVAIFDRVLAREVVTDKLCVEDVCVTREQFAEVFVNPPAANSSANPIDPAATEDAAPPPDPNAAAPMPSADDDTASTSPPVPSEVSALSPNPPAD